MTYDACHESESVDNVLQTVVQLPSTFSDILELLRVRFDFEEE